MLRTLDPFSKDPTIAPQNSTLSLPFSFTEESDLIETAVKLTALDVAQDNRALTLISAYAMYTSNVDVMLLEQVRHALTIFKAKHPQAKGMFIFDNAPSHIKCGHSRE